jgi:1,2-diacylglycerol 3-alpha-glucosyltransferase
MKNKLKILIALESYPPTINGSGIATRRLVTGLARRGHEVTVFCPGKTIRNDIKIEDGVSIYRISSLPVIFYKEYRFSPFANISIKNIYKKLNPDIVHIIDHLFVAGAVHKIAKKNKIKTIGTNYFTPNNWLINLKIKKNSALYKICEKILWQAFLKIYNKIDIITVPTFYSKKLIQSICIKKSVKVISCGIDLGMFKKNKIDENIFIKFKIDKNKITLLSVSRLDKEKRVGVLLKALYLIKDKIDFQCIVTGSGKDKKNLETFVLENGLSNKVIFTDFVSDSDLKNLYKISNIFLTASEVELQGLSIMEALASGLPVIASNSMAIPELVQDGVNGYLFEEGNASDASKKIMKLANDKELRDKMSLNSLKIIQEHDIEITLNKFEEIYYQNLAKAK